MQGQRRASERGNPVAHAGSPPAVPLDARLRLDRLRARRLAEDERLVCMERARILDASRHRYTHLSRTMRQAAILRDLCEKIAVVTEPEDILLGCMPQALPTAQEEEFIARCPELFVEPGVPGWLDSLSIYIPDWDWLVEAGLGGIADAARQGIERLEPGAAEADGRREFLRAGVDALTSVSRLIRRYADEARRQAEVTDNETRRAELLDAAARCDRVAEEAPRSFVDALQLLQITHMVLSCLVGGRDVTPGRLDQYLAPLYHADVAAGRLSRDEAVVLLAHFLFRLSEMTGNGTDFDDNLRRTPCQFSHLYVTVGGAAEDGSSAANDLSLVILDAIDLLAYKEPTVVVRWGPDTDASLVRRVAELIRRRRPVTIYSDEVVTAALVSQGVPAEWAAGYAHSACHNVIVAGHEAGSGPGGFHNLPQLVLLALSESGDVETFEQFMLALRAQVRRALECARTDWEKRWSEVLEPSVQLLQSCLMRESIADQRPCWQSARISHFNHYLMGLATTVDSLIAVRRVVFDDRRMSVTELADVLARNWDGHEALHREIQTRLPRYGQDSVEARDITRVLGQMWVEEVERASRGMSRVEMWPGFYSHMVHLQAGATTPATPDGRMAGEPLSENLGPSRGTPPCAPTSVLGNMSILPFHHTPSGAATLMLSPNDFSGDAGLAKLLALIEGYFDLGGLQIQINLTDAETLTDAMRNPDQYADLMVRVAGFSALFTRLSHDVQQDIVARSHSLAASSDCG